MNEHSTTTETVKPGAVAASAAPAQQQPAMRAVTDPREVAALVLARTQQVKGKRDELASAIDGLADLTRQLTRSYGQQAIAIEQLRRRVKALETAAGHPGSDDPVQ
ncbi:MAG TPA: hypothetical protein VFM98_14630 [Ramlibacter sp.]|uniref:hypothetical protein n=1 Tax=Ramlibacter sp. TaxID=1917967 RepID=UPI002D8076AB|nr:hypothetical protein [Ramlibacter sp.]HET8746840.1 hypothetical protein [Ramlibacter sp.]